MKKKIFIVAAVIFSNQLQAQKVAANQDSTKSLDEVVITATKTLLKQSQTGKVVSIIDNATLQRNAGKTVTEILNYQAGIFINGANNNLGTNQDVYFRGASTGNVLILIDGVPVGDASQINNSFDLNSIATTQIEKIEILKGAQSTLWGSDAAAGVINIITKKGGANKIGATAGLAYGSYNTLKANAGINGKLQAFTYNLAYNHINSKGFSSAYDSTGNKNFDKDGFIQHTVQANVGYQFTNKLAASVYSNFSTYTTDIDGGAFKDDKDYTAKNTNSINTIALVYQLKKGAIHLTNTLTTSKRNLNNDTTKAIENGDLYKADYTGNSFVSELYATYAFTKKITAVAGFQHLTQATTQTYNGYSRDYAFGYAGALSKDSTKSNNLSFYTSLLLTNIKGFNIEAGFRLNNHSVYGTNSTFTFNPSYNIDDNTKVFLNISSAYKIPSLYQLYSEYGNKKLKPESTTNVELGVQSFSNSKKNSIRLVAFKREIKDLIIFYTQPITYASQYINRDTQNDYGFEIENTIAIGKIGNWINNFTYVAGEGMDNNVKVNNLYRRPNFTFNSTLTVQPIKGLVLMPSVRFVGTRLKGQYDAGPAVMPSYYTIDFYAGYTINKMVSVFADVRNITDQKYVDVVGYNNRATNVAFGLTASF